MESPTGGNGFFQTRFDPLQPPPGYLPPKSLILASGL